MVWVCIYVCICRIDIENVIMAIDVFYCSITRLEIVLIAVIESHISCQPRLSKDSNIAFIKSPKNSIT